MEPECRELKERAKASRSEYAKRLMSGNAVEHQGLYEKISGLSHQLELRLDCPPQVIAELEEELRRAIKEFESLSS
jgi:hypothetical protein